MSTTSAQAMVEALTGVPSLAVGSDTAQAAMTGQPTGGDSGTPTPAAAPPPATTGTDATQPAAEAIKPPGRRTTVDGNPVPSPSRAGWDADRYIKRSGKAYDTDDPDFEWKTGHTPCGDDDNDP
jgi:hypothetical protein